jgi:hypothetical protein
MTQGAVVSKFGKTQNFILTNREKLRSTANIWSPEKDDDFELVL